MALDSDAIVNQVEKSLQSGDGKTAAAQLIKEVNKSFANGTKPNEQDWSQITSGLENKGILPQVAIGIIANDFSNLDRDKNKELSKEEIQKSNIPAAFKKLLVDKYDAIKEMSTNDGANGKNADGITMSDVNQLLADMAARKATKGDVGDKGKQSKDAAPSPLTLDQQNAIVLALTKDNDLLLKQISDQNGNITLEKLNNVLTESTRGGGRPSEALLALSLHFSEISNDGKTLNFNEWAKKTILGEIAKDPVILAQVCDFNGNISKETVNKMIKDSTLGGGKPNPLLLELSNNFDRMSADGGKTIQDDKLIQPRIIAGLLQDKAILPQLLDDNGHISKESLDHLLVDSTRGGGRPSGLLLALQKNFDSLSADGGKSIDMDQAARKFGVELALTYTSQFNLVQYLEQDKQFLSVLLKDSGGKLDLQALTRLKTQYETGANANPERADVLKQLIDSFPLLAKDGKIDLPALITKTEEPVRVLLDDPKQLRKILDENGNIDKRKLASEIERLKGSSDDSKALQALLKIYSAFDTLAVDGILNSDRFARGLGIELSISPRSLYNLTEALKHEPTTFTSQFIDKNGKIDAEKVDQILKQVDSGQAPNVTAVEANILLQLQVGYKTLAHDGSMTMADLQKAANGYRSALDGAAATLKANPQILRQITDTDVDGNKFVSIKRLGELARKNGEHGKESPELSALLQDLYKIAPDGKTVDLKLLEGADKNTSNAKPNSGTDGQTVKDANGWVKECKTEDKNLFFEYDKNGEVTQVYSKYPDGRFELFMKEGNKWIKQTGSHDYFDPNTIEVSGVTVDKNTGTFKYNNSKPGKAGAIGGGGGGGSNQNLVMA